MRLMSNDPTTVFPTPSRRSNVSFERERGVYAIQVTYDVAHAVVSIDVDAGRSEAILRIFQALTNAGVPIFLIKLHRTAVSFALTGADVSRAEATFETAGFVGRTRRDLAMVVVKAASMRDVAGIMVDIADALYDAGARLYGTGDSHDSVQCLIEAQRVEAVIEQLRVKFGLEAEAVEEHSLDAEGAR
jgi:aspartate kinase